MQNSDGPGGRHLEHGAKVAGAAAKSGAIEVPITGLNQRTCGADSMSAVEGEEYGENTLRRDLEHLAVVAGGTSIDRRPIEVTVGTLNEWCGGKSAVGNNQGIESLKQASRRNLVNGAVRWGHNSRCCAIGLFIP